MDDLLTRAELLRMKAELLINLGTEVRDMAADLARQATATPTATAARTSESIDVSALLPDARKAYAELKAAGRLRDYGHRVSGAKAQALWRALAAENVPPVRGPASRDAPAPPANPPETGVSHASLNGHPA